MSVSNSIEVAKLYKSILIVMGTDNRRPRTRVQHKELPRHSVRCRRARAVMPGELARLREPGRCRGRVSTGARLLNATRPRPHAPFVYALLHRNFTELACLLFKIRVLSCFLNPGQSNVIDQIFS